MAAPNTPSSSNTGVPIKGYSPAAPYDNKTDKPDDPSFLDPEGNPDKQALEDNKAAEEDKMEISEEEEFKRMEELARGRQEAILKFTQQLFPKLPMDVHSFYYHGFTWVKHYWREGLTDRIVKGFKDLDAKIMEYNRQKKRPHTEWRFPHQEIIGTFEIYKKMFIELKTARGSRKKELVERFLEGNRMFVRGLAQTGIRLKEIVTLEVWEVVADFLVEWGS